MKILRVISEYRWPIYLGGLLTLAGMPRPVDVYVADRAGAPVAGLAGSLFAIRPADTRLNQTAELVAIPQPPGRYRTLVRLDAPGAWDVRIDVRQGALRFVHGARLTVPAEAAGGREEAR